MTMMNHESVMERNVDKPYATLLHMYYGNIKVQRSQRDSGHLIQLLSMFGEKKQIIAKIDSCSKCR